MPELTARDYWSLLGLCLILVAGFLVVRSRRRKNNERKEAFRGYLVGRILTFKVVEGLPLLHSQSAAATYVAGIIERVRGDYIFRNGSAFTGNLTEFCEEVVQDLCDKDIIPLAHRLGW